MRKDIIVSSRVRLARNIAKHPFPNRLKNEEAGQIVKDIRGILSEKKYTYIDIKNNSRLDNLVLVENHIISAEMLKGEIDRAVFLEKSTEASIMVNEEDHIRIQSIVKGDNMEAAFKYTSEIDDKLDKKLMYAFNSEYGYLTACPTNVGTAMRASFMIHLPMLEVTNQIKNAISFLGKLGIAVRGMYGEGTEAKGSLYQVSNQITLGQSEAETIERLNDVVTQIINQEIKIRNKLYSEQKIKLVDEIYRAYGILTNAKLMNIKEGMLLLSYVKLGMDMQLIDKTFVNEVDIFDLMIKIQKSNIEKQAERKLQATERDEERAKIIQSKLLSDFGR
ncbi:MAG TPA: protein arginine kinase [Clostridiales bacterium]|nr:MAG: protein arginine kinase [Clostridiales bacterium GWD2_32_19]HCC08139.1 protein arginine kinase [Clostridiales bacterium]